MLTIRAHNSENVEKHHGRTFVDVTANGANIPLEGQDWQQRWCTLPISEDAIRRIYEFPVRDDDIFVVTFPKCGTTWMQEATWLLMNNLDFETANQTDLLFRSVFMDLSVLYQEMPRDTIDQAHQAPSPRVLKSHLPAHLIPKQIWEKKTKIVYCARNPKDTVVSYFHFFRGKGSWQGNIDEFVEDLINNDVMYAPYWQHVIDFWRMRHEKNIFFTTYEDMKRDLRGVLIQLNKFLGKPDLNDEQLNKLEQHLSFESMKANKSSNPTSHIKAGKYHKYPIRPDFEFMRRGIVGSHKDELSHDMQQKLDDWIAEHSRKLNFKFEDIFGVI